MKLMHGGLFPSVASCLSRRRQNVDLDQYYTINDMDLLANNFSSDLAFLTMNWRHMLGRPTFTMIAHAGMIGNVGLRDCLTIENSIYPKNMFMYSNSQGAAICVYFPIYYEVLRKIFLAI